LAPKTPVVNQAPRNASASTARLINLLSTHTRIAVQRLMADPHSELGQYALAWGGLLPQPGPQLEMQLRVREESSIGRSPSHEQVTHTQDDVVQVSENTIRGSDHGGPARCPPNSSVPEDRIIGWFDDDYPPRLRNIPDPPLVLYTRGRWQALHEPQISIVGARRCTRHGKQIAQRMASHLAACHVGVTSGLALGIDGAAHKGALQGSLGYAATVAVLGAGLGKIYPAAHGRLAHDIVARGGVLCSEYVDAQAPRPYQFPERNRIIAGLSIATIVVEAGARSGSLITAKCALEQGRDVFAVPGSIDSQVNQGCHQLIQQGAGLITSAAQVLEELGFDSTRHSTSRTSDKSDKTDKTAENGLSALQQRVFAQLCDEPLLLEELQALLQGNHQHGSNLKLEVGEILQALVELELLGIVAKRPLGYIRVS